MKEAIKPKDWCNSPYYVRDLADLYKVGSRVDAWREFLLSKKVDILRGLGMSVCSFNQHSMFENLIIMLDCTEDEAIAGVKSIMRAEFDRDVEFRRLSIHDIRAWAQLPLSCFADAQGFNDWTEWSDGGYQSDVLKFNLMPCFQIGIKKEWIVSADCFSFSHKIKVDKKHWPVEKKRFAQISFNHPHLDRRFEGNQHVSSGYFPVDKNIALIREELMEQAMVVCAKQGVVVQEKE
jgi:hypothetical protein